MEIELRDTLPDDAEGWSRVIRDASPYLVWSAQRVRHELANPVGLVAHGVAVRDGEVVGAARVRDYTAVDGKAGLLVQVRPDLRRRGIGTGLVQWCLARLDGVPAHTLTGIVSDDEESRAAVRSWGFVPGRAHAIAAVDPRTAPAPGPVPAGLVLGSLAEAGPRAVWECSQVSVADDPSGLSRPAPYDEFRTSDWADPDGRPALGRALLAGGEVVAFAMVSVAGERAWNSMTATRPSHRGAGLARLVKTHSLRALAEDGIIWCGTGNDAANVPMLAVNRALGYVPFARTRDAERPWESR